MIDKVQATAAFLASSGTFDYLTGVYDYEFNWELAQKGKAPFINVDSFARTTGEIPRMSFSEADRSVIWINFHYCQKSKDYKTAFTGKTGTKGIAEIETDIFQLIVADPTLGGIFSGFEMPIKIDSGFETLENGLYIAIGRMTVGFRADRFRIN